MDELLADRFILIRLEGKVDIGKTQVLSQFVRRHPNNAISLFIRPDSWYLQDPSFLYNDLAAQMHWALHREEPPSSFVADEKAVRTLSFELQRKGRRENQLFYLILDGVDEVAPASGHFLSCVLRVLPTEYKQFRFVCGGSASYIPLATLPNNLRKTLSLTGFSFLETSYFLEGLDLSPRQVEDIYKTSGRGVPGYLGSARRLLQSGIAPDDLIERLSDDLKESFAVEWNAQVCDDNFCRKLLAIIAYDTNPHSSADLSDILGVPLLNVESTIKRCSFLETTAGESSATYVSESSRRFAVVHLEDQEHQTWALLADYYSRSKEKVPLDSLPVYLEKAGRQKELLNVLNPAALVALAQQSESFLPLQDRCELGLKTALALKRYDESLRFQLQSAVAADISRFEFAEAEVVARLSLDDYKNALRIAQTASLKRHRLQLMAAIARVQKSDGLVPEPTLIQAVEILVQQVEPKEFGDDLESVASDLMYVDANLALSFVSRLTPDVIDRKDVDLALLHLTTIAADKATADAGMSSALEDIQSKIHNPTARRFAKTLSILVVDLTPHELLNQVKTVGSPGDQLFLLREWCSHCRHPETAAPVLDYAVHLAIRTTEYRPSAGDFRAFSEPLPLLSNVDNIASLITSLDIQKEAARSAGPTQDYVQWQLLIAEAEDRISSVRSGQRLFEIYDYVTSLKELDVKTVCLGLIVAALPKIDSSGAFDETPLIRDDAEQEFERAVSSLLASTADHSEISRPIINSLGRSRPDLAIKVIQQINYESRRDAALSVLCRVLLRCPPEAIAIQELNSLIGRWKDTEVEDDAIDDIIAAISRIEKSEVLRLHWDQVAQIIERALRTTNPWLQCRMLSSSLALYTRSEIKDLALQSKMIAALESAWKSIGDPAVKLRTGYQIAAGLADSDRELAKEYLRRTDLEKTGYSDLSNSAFTSCLRLLIRSYSGLLPQRLEVPNDLERITSLVERVPQTVSRIFLWTDIALRSDREKHRDISREIVRKRILPALDSLRGSCIHEWCSAMVFAAPALYVFSPVTIGTYLDRLPEHSQDWAYNNVLRYLWTEVPPGEPFNKGGAAGYDLGFDKCAEILKVAENVDIDYLVYKYIAIVAEAARWQHNRYPLSQEQKNELGRMIRELSLRKFPNPRCITHDGFAILAEAQAVRLVREKQANWTPLIDRSRNLRNEADRAFVLMHLADVLHSGLTDIRNTLNDEAHAASLAIPSTRDRVEHLNLLAGIVQQYDPAQAKALISEAVEVLQGKPEDGTEEICRNLVDLAYQIDPDFASSLTSALDQDKGRQVARSRLAYQKLKDKWKQEEEEIELESASGRERLDGIAWDLLGSLNAGRVPPRSFKSCISTLSHVHGMALHDQFGTFSWALENLIKKRAASGEAESLLRGVFEALLTASELGAAVIARAAGHTMTTIQYSPSKDGYLVKAGHRENALEFLTGWLGSHETNVLYICDPYFGRKEMEAIHLALRVNPRLRVRVLTSRRKQEQDLGKLNLGLDEAYRQYWRQNFSDQDPLDCEIVIIGNNAGDLPIHDRWWLTQRDGIRIGTSFNQLGVNKDSEISSLDSSEVEERIQEIESLIRREKREHMGERLTYQAVPF